MDHRIKEQVNLNLIEHNQRMTSLVESFVRESLMEIHQEQFKNHDIRLVDAMGMVVLYVGDFSIVNCNIFHGDRSITNHIGVFNELRYIYDWYCDTSEHYNIAIQDINILKK